MKSDAQWGREWDVYWKWWLSAYSHTIEYPGESRIPLEFDAGYVKDKNVLEIGCGIGLLAAKVNTLVSHYYGLDISPFAIEYAKTLCPDKTDFFLVQTEQQYKKVEEELHQKVDAVLARHVFIHLGESKVIRYLRLAQSVLKKDGILYCNFFRPVEDKLSAPIYSEKSIDQTSGAVVYFPKEHIEDLLGRTGFKIGRMIEVAERYEVIAK
jgi:SAM-dependent methyltransferase